MRRVWQLTLWLLVPLSLAPTLGCGRGPSLAPVSGRVTMNGKPLAGAEVSYYPTTPIPDVPYASGLTDDQGRYTLTTTVGGNTSNGAPVGESRVTISRNRINAPSKQQPKALLGSHDDVPAKYNQDSTLTCSVPPAGTDAADFTLTTGR